MSFQASRQTISQTGTQSNNLFLESLSSPGREWLLSRSTPVQLPIRSPLYDSETVPEYAYFMTSGIASVVTAMADGKSAEVGVIGREGIVGAFHLLGPAPLPTDCFIQITATALRIRMPDLRAAFRNSEEIRDRVLEFAQEQSLSLSQLAGCHRLHEQEERLARWLLMVQDRTRTDALEITQEFLAQMLGAKRTTVTVVASALQRAGLIEYTRGKIKILDRPGLETKACGCYQVVRNLYVNLYKDPWVRPPAYTMNAPVVPIGPMVVTEDIADKAE
jgi:CRP-like cAMP-binding protein